MAREEGSSASEAAETSLSVHGAGQQSRKSRKWRLNRQLLPLSGPDGGTQLNPIRFRIAAFATVELPHSLWQCRRTRFGELPEAFPYQLGLRPLLRLGHSFELESHGFIQVHSRFHHIWCMVPLLAVYSARSSAAASSIWAAQARKALATFLACCKASAGRPPSSASRIPGSVFTPYPV